MLRYIRGGFTLIELLIVVAIIAILAAIAVPNFLEAQVRSKVSRVKADMRSAAVAIEAYALDNNAYPYSQLPLQIIPAAVPRDWVFPGGYPLGNVGNNEKFCAGVTTPIAYITSSPIDPFDTKLLPLDGYQNCIHYVSRRFGYDRAPNVSQPMKVLVPADAANGTSGPFLGTGPDMPVQHGMNGRVPSDYLLYSQGPDTVFFLDTNGDGTPDIRSIYNLNNLYDPTNGSVSPGNVVRFPAGGNSPS